MEKKVKNSWNLNLVIKNFDQKIFNKELIREKRTQLNFIEKWAKVDFTKNEEILYKFLLEDENLDAEFGTIGGLEYYLHLRQSLEEDSADIKAYINKLTEVVQEIQIAREFIVQKLSKIPEENKIKFLASKKLNQFRHFLEVVFENSKHILSEAEEKIVTLTSKTSYSNWVNLVSQLISTSSEKIVIEKNIKKELSFEELLTNSSYSSSKPLRDKSTLALNRIFEKWGDVVESEINTVFENKKTFDKLRGYTTPFEARAKNDEISPEIIESLVNAVHNDNKFSTEFYETKSKILGFKKLKYNEKNLETLKIPSTYTFEQAVEIVSSSFRRLDNDFDKIFRDMLKNGQIDVFPKKGKSTGAFCTHHTKKYPIYVLLNFTNKLNDITTLAHEMGHAIHFEYAKEQISYYNGSSTATAEVASTFMEDFVVEELENGLSLDQKADLLMFKINDFVSSVHRQVAIYKFEEELHTNFRKFGYLSKAQIGEAFLKNMSHYLGKYVDLSGFNNFWMYISHIRRFFYVYSYASGTLISKALQSSVKENKNEIEKFKNILKMGSSDYVYNIFLKNGINLGDDTFWKTGLQHVHTQLMEVRKIKGI